jgi:hypothetical protein
MSWLSSTWRVAWAAVVVVVIDSLSSSSTLRGRCRQRVVVVVIDALWSMGLGRRRRGVVLDVAWVGSSSSAVIYAMGVSVLLS